MASSAPPVKGQSGQLPSSPHVAIVDAPTAIDEQRSSTASMLSVSTALTSTTHPSIWDLESDDVRQHRRAMHCHCGASFTPKSPPPCQRLTTLTRLPHPLDPPPQPSTATVASATATTTITTMNNNIITIAAAATTTGGYC